MELRVCRTCHNTGRKSDGTIMASGWARNLLTGEVIHFPATERPTYSDEICDCRVGQMILATTVDEEANK